VLAGVSGRLNLAWTTTLIALTSAAIAGLGVVIAGPICGVISDHTWLTLLLAWWYVAIIGTLGVGLHPLLKHWTTPAFTALFVMLNFTSSGGVFAPALPPAFFGGLHSFWLGAAWLHASQTMQYFWGQDIGGDAITMGGWSAVAVLLLVLTRQAVRRSKRPEVPITEVDEVVTA
jgi:ABC-type multidrug transport system permease subunit